MTQPIAGNIKYITVTGLKSVKKYWSQKGKKCQTFYTVCKISALTLYLSEFLKIFLGPL